MKKVVSFAAAIALYLLFFAYVMYKSLNRDLDFSDYQVYSNVILQGWFTTVFISLISISLSLVIGLIIYFMQESNIKILHYIAEIHKTLVFATPLLVIAIVAYYYIGNSFNITDKILVGSLTLGLYISAYIADIYKGAIESIHINQWQAAKMFGFNKYQTYRYIIFPQVIRSILPPLAGQFALTIKGTSLLSYMGTSELLNSVQQIMAATYKSQEGFIIVSIGYWIITIPLILMVRKLEEKANYTV
ncbi:amino acid ABC transporter permease [Acidaminobacter sp. JC074]|uniref:amino acid ABC transporter permease n=1 Tax=Acidaminobacter sp. JC074 TaxID=2530199 RepID=UPI001F0F356F|nr:amino acid ABC transporter permease [Acidaminobacter sp. JC074]MCH4887994.1 amino acid ABC transporter permease [Acidaminobacter sp. JC074]